MSSSSSEQPTVETDELNRTKSDNLNTTTAKSTPYISHDKTKPDKKQVNRSSRYSQSDGSIIKPEENAGVKKKINRVWGRSKDDRGKVLQDSPEKDVSR